MEWAKIKLTETQLNELNEAEKTANEKQIKKIIALRLKHKQKKNNEIGEALNMNPKTIGEWIKEYKTEGLEKYLKYNYKGRKSKLKEKDQEKIKERIKEKPFQDIKEARAFIKEECGIKFSLSWTTQFIKKNFNCHSKN